MSGERGTRISELFSDIPKPLIPICGKSVLEHEMQCLKEQGFIDIILTVSHMADKIIDHFGDSSKLGVHIEYFVEDQPLGNAGTLFIFKDKLTEDFLDFSIDLKDSWMIGDGEYDKGAGRLRDAGQKLSRRMEIC